MATDTAAPLALLAVRWYKGGVNHELTPAFVIAPQGLCRRGWFTYYWRFS